MKSKINQNTQECRENIKSKIIKLEVYEIYEQTAREILKTTRKLFNKYRSVLDVQFRNYDANILISFFNRVCMTELVKRC